VFKSLAKLFTRPTVEAVVHEDLYQAQRGLLDAEANAEAWAAQVQVYKVRVARLTRKASEVTTPSHVGSNFPSTTLVPGASTVMQ
jgi:hypothetical protein